MDRTSGQNRRLWKLIRKIAKATGQTLDEVYGEVLERTDAVSDFIIAPRKAERGLREEFRCVILRQKINSELNMYQVYSGTSMMDSREMAEVIDIAQQMACELGVDYGEVYNA